MKTYGHLRREHSIAQAQRVTFSLASTKQADVIAFPVPASATAPRTPMASETPKMRR